MRFQIISLAISKNHAWSVKYYSKSLIVNHRIMKITCLSVVSTVPADGLVLSQSNLCPVCTWNQHFNKFRPRQDCCDLADNIFKCIFNFIWSSTEAVPKGAIDNIPALVQIMAWRGPGDKPLSEPIWLVYWRIYASPGLKELNVYLLNIILLWHIT